VETSPETPHGAWPSANGNENGCDCENRHFRVMRLTGKRPRGSQNEGRERDVPSSDHAFESPNIVRAAAQRYVRRAK